MILNKPSKKLTKTDYLERLSAAEIEIADLKRQLAESEALRQVSEASLNEAEIEALFAAQYDIVFLFDTAMSLQRINPPFITYFGFNPVGLNVKEITHRVSCRRLDGTPIVWEEQLTPRALSDVKVTNAYFKVTRADGAEAIVETTSVPIVQNGYVTGSVTVWHDITKLTQTEQALSESEERYRLLYENSIDGILLTTPDGGILAANAAACRIFGRTEAEICRLGRNGLVDTSDPRVMPAVEERARTGHKKAEMFLVRGDGTRFTGEVTSTIFRGQDGRLMTSMIVRDITERRRAEDALRENEGRLLQAQELLEAITQGTDVIIAAVDTNYCYTFFNKAYHEEIVRLSGKDITVGTNMIETFAHLPEQQKTVATEWSEVLGGKNTSKIVKFGDPGRYQRFYNVLHTPIWNIEGKIVGAGEVARDVTEMVRSEEALRESEGRFRLALKHAPVTVAAQDQNLRFIWAYNQRTVNPVEIIGKTDMDIFPPETAARLTTLKRQVLETGEEISEQMWVTSGGRRLFLDVFLEPIRDRLGVITGVGVATVDLTDRKLAELALLSAYEEVEERVQMRAREQIQLNEQLQNEIAERKLVEAQLRLQTSALEAAANGVIITNKAGEILWANPAFTDMTGYTLDEIHGKNPRFLKSNTQDNAFYQELWDTILSGQVWRGELTNRRKDGSFYVEEQTITPVFDENKNLSNFIAVKQDITNRRKEEQKRRESEERYRSLVAATAQIVWTANANGEVVEDIPSWRAFTGQSLEDIRGPGLLNAFHPEDRQRATKEWGLSVRNKTIFDTEFRLRRYDGEYRYFNVRGVPVLENDQRVREWVGICLDITERILAERELKRVSAYNRNLIEVSLDPLVTITQSGKVSDVNTSTEAVTGFSREELIGTDFHSYFTSPDKARAGYQQVFEKGFVRDYELEIQHKDGPVTPVLYNASVYRDENGEIMGVFAAARDITELRKAEAILEQKNRELLALSQAEHKQRQLAETLRLTSLALTQTLDIDKELGMLLEYMEELIPFDSASAALLGGDNRLIVRAVRGDRQWVDTDQDIVITADGVIPTDFMADLATPQSVLFSDLHEILAWSPLPGIEQMHSWIGVPLVTEGRLFGLCSLGKTEPGFYTQEHVHLAEAFVAQASMAVQNAWLFEQVRAGRERLQALSRRLVEIQETERRSIARELHDEAGQALASLVIGLRLLEQEARNPEAAIARVADLRRITDSVMEELHRLAMDLRPASLDQLGLVAALKQFIETLNERQTIFIQFEALGFERGRLSPAVETSFYRIVQEALTNAIRHSKATEIAVILDWRKDAIIMIVEDNGVGFNIEGDTAHRRMGLAGMRERAEMLGGRFTIESEFGAGTTIHVEVPYGNSNTGGR